MQPRNCVPDLDLNAEIMHKILDSESVTFCRISGCQSDVYQRCFRLAPATEIAEDSPFVQSKIIQVSWSAWQQYSYRNALHLNCRIYVVEATLENKCTVSVCVFKTTITQVMLSVLSLFILFPVVFHVALVYNYFYL